MASAQIVAHGLRELILDLKRVDGKVPDDLRHSLEDSGDIVRDEARKRLTIYGQSVGHAFSFSASATTIETRLRLGGGAQAFVFVGQKRRKSRTQQARRPNYGGLQVKHALLPARDAKIREARKIVERAIVRRLRRHNL